MKFIKLQGTLIVSLLIAESPPDNTWQEAGSWVGFSERPAPGWQPHLIDGVVVWQDETQSARSLEVAWTKVRLKRASLFKRGDDEILKALRLGQPIPQVWADYNQALADVTLQSDPFNIVWPTPPTT